jgi:hypothetical protein
MDLVSLLTDIIHFLLLLGYHATKLSELQAKALLSNVQKRSNFVQSQKHATARTNLNLRREVLG